MSKHKGKLWQGVKRIVLRILLIWAGLWLAGILLFPFSRCLSLP